MVIIGNLDSCRHEWRCCMPSSSRMIALHAGLALSAEQIAQLGSDGHQGSDAIRRQQAKRSGSASVCK